MTFVSPQLLRMGDCDTAGIAYYPRLLALVDNAVEDWMAATLGIDRAGLLQGRGLGLPTADLKLRFERPCRLGETIGVGLAVTALGTASITLAVAGDVAGQRCFAGTLVQVLVTLADGKPQPWPQAWRDRLVVAPEDMLA